ncbi:hypothetical protein CXB51_027159 [Gossypium anomalum]|uniref:RNase H type-1 domain-containing protein n=1 Tax=Gossypium anomalum TaxID=47600 RepID=A0A8J6CSL7_9ROSI|nr:hypothetical protein CXB51_027159 [Gossypium anomalum]
MAVGMYWLLHWTPSPTGFLKFNVNGATRGCLGSAGCGGVFRDNKGVVIALFSNLLGSTLPLITELVAIKLATCFFDQSARRCDKGLIIIESDSATVVSWFIKKDDRPWKLWCLFDDIDRFSSKIGLISFHHVNRD